MNSFTHMMAPSTELMSAGTCITILYEDRPAGIRAKRFSDMLLVSFGRKQDTPPACWRIELIDFPEIAEEITRDAVASEFVILSLRGEVGLSMNMKIWIESCLANVVPGSVSLIALFDPQRCQRNAVESARLFLRQSATEAGAEFFAHCLGSPISRAKRRVLTSREDAAGASRTRHRELVRHNHTVHFSDSIAA